MKIRAFNPWGGDDTTPGCGFNTADIVDAQRSLTNGPKRVYARLAIPCSLPGGNAASGILLVTPLPCLIRSTTQTPCGNWMRSRARFAQPRAIETGESL